MHTGSVIMLVPGPSRHMIEQQLALSVQICTCNLRSRKQDVTGCDTCNQQQHAHCATCSASSQ